ncbi:hypothetical protein D3C76_720600 [compost metagenome]
MPVAVDGYPVLIRLDRAAFKLQERPIGVTQQGRPQRQRLAEHLGFEGRIDTGLQTLGRRLNEHLLQ